MNGNPYCSAPDLPAWRCRPDQPTRLLADFVLGAVSDCTVDYLIPGGPTVRLGRSFADRVDDPLGRLILDGCETVTMTSFGFTVEHHILTELFGGVACPARRERMILQPVHDLSEALGQFL
ncbi:MAG: hypothetical protein QGD91_11850, partial [Actinomycetota bacterium]|nr:hypothetical protein [Actinomycetota bacterium]